MWCMKSSLGLQIFDLKGYHFILIEKFLFLWGHFLIWSINISFYSNFPFKVLQFKFEQTKKYNFYYLNLAQP